MNTSDLVRSCFSAPNATKTSKTTYKAPRMMFCELNFYFKFFLDAALENKMTRLPEPFANDFFHQISSMECFVCPHFTLCHLLKDILLVFHRVSHIPIL